MAETLLAIGVILALGIVIFSAFFFIGLPLILLVMELEWRWLAFVDDRLHIIKRD